MTNLRSSLIRSFLFLLALASLNAFAWMPTAAFWQQRIVQGMQLFAGALGGLGSLDATGTAARVYQVSGLTTDTSGNLYFSDSYNDTVRSATAGTFAVTTVAGLAINAGSTSGTGGAASFRIPLGLARDSSGNLFVADSNNAQIRKITSAGAVSVFAGGGTAKTNGTGTAAGFNSPTGVAIDSSGNLYVADANDYLVRKITTGAVVTTLAGSGSFGSTNATGTSASFSNMIGIAVDSSGNVYVADTYNHMIRKITSAGVVTTLAGSTSGGYANATGTSAKFAYPRGVAVDGSGNVYVADTNNNRIRQITSTGVTTLLAGSGNAIDADGTGAAASFNAPWAITYDSATSSLYVSDSGTAGGCGTCAPYGSTIRKVVIASGVVTTVIGAALPAGNVQGTRLSARFNTPTGIAQDSKGNIYVVDNTVGLIRKIAGDGTVSVFAGSGSGTETDGTGAAAGFRDPVGITADPSDNLYVADRLGQTIRKITTPGAVVTTLAGQANTTGFANGTGTAATFSNPDGVVADKLGNIYVADYYNSAIRKITPAGVVTTFAGGNTEADGTGTAAGFSGPYGIAIDSSSNLYVTDQGVGTVRKITPAAVVTTIGGLAYNPGTTDGTAAASRFRMPAAIAVSSSGNVYVSDTNAYTIRKITPGGTVSTPFGVANQGATSTGALPGHVGQVVGMFISGPYMYFTSDDAVIKSSIP